MELNTESSIEGQTYEIRCQNRGNFPRIIIQLGQPYVDERGKSHYEIIRALRLRIERVNASINFQRIHV